MSLFTHFLQPNTSTTFQTFLTFYIYQSDTHQRVMNTLNQFELIISYTTIQRRLKKITKKAQQKIKMINKTSITVLVYDNFEFAVHYKGERISDS